MSYFSWSDIDLVAGNIVVAKILTVNHDDMTATVEGIDGDIPIHYHCDQTGDTDTGESWEESYPDSLDEGGSQAFSVDDEVLVMFRREGNTSPVIVGFRGESQYCGGYALIFSLGKVLIWDLLKNEKATNIELNGDAGYAIFPCDYSDISEWIESREAWEGWSELFDYEYQDSNYKPTDHEGGTAYDYNNRVACELPLFQDHGEAGYLVYNGTRGQQSTIFADDPLNFFYHYLETKFYLEERCTPSYYYSDLEYSFTDYVWIKRDQSLGYKWTAKNGSNEVIDSYISFHILSEETKIGTETVYYGNYTYKCEIDSEETISTKWHGGDTNIDVNPHTHSETVIYEPVDPETSPPNCKKQVQSGDPELFPINPTENGNFKQWRSGFYHEDEELMFQLFGVYQNYNADGENEEEYLGAGGYDPDYHDWNGNPSSQPKNSDLSDALIELLEYAEEQNSEFSIEFKR